VVHGLISAILDRFVSFVQTAKPGIKEFVEVTPEIAKAFMDAEQAVKTSKTGEKVDIPVFPLLREELERATAEDSPYCTLLLPFTHTYR
jgi:hypothetical protein